MLKSKVLFVVAIMIASVCLPSAEAKIVMDANATHGAGAYPCSNTDLINHDSTALLSESRDEDCWFASGDFSVPWANDGSVSTTGEWYLAKGDAHTIPATLTFMLDTSASATKNGYDITRIDSFSGYAENWNVLCHQSFRLEMSKVDDDSWFSMGTYKWTPFDDNVQKVGEGTSLYIRLTNDSGGPLDNGTSTATNIDGIRFVYLDPGIFGNQHLGTILQEIDVHSPSPRPPASKTIHVLLTIGTLSLLGLVLYVWRKRKNNSSRK